MRAQAAGASAQRVAWPAGPPGRLGLAQWAQVGRMARLVGLAQEAHVMLIS